MNNEEKKVSQPPRRRGHGPMGGGSPAEKAKDFKGAVKRLFQELKGFKYFILFALILAMLGSVLSIVAPNKLSDLTDTISDGLVVNTDNLKKVTTEVTNNLSEEKLKKTLPEVLSIKMDQNTMYQIMMDTSIKQEEKNTFQALLETKNQQKIIEELGNYSDRLLKHLLPNSKYKGKEITFEDKKQLLSMMKKKNQKEVTLSKTMQEILFSPITIDKVEITSSDQYQYLKIMNTMKKDASPQELYSKIDQMPKSIGKVIKPKMDMTKIKKIALFLAILYICSATFTYIESLSMTVVSNKFAKKLRKNISSKINRLPLKYFDKHTTGDILSRVTNDVDTIAQSMNQSLAMLVSSITLFIGSLIMMFVTNWVMALTAVLSSIIGFIGMMFILSKSQKYFVSRQEELGNLNGHIEEVYSGLNVVKAYNGKKEADKKFDIYNEKVRISNQKGQFLSGLMQPMMNFIGNFGYVAVCIVGALLTMNDKITFGVIVAFISYVRLFTSPLAQIAQAMTSLQSTAAASERVFEFLDEKEMSEEKNKKAYLKKEEVKGNIDFLDVVFKYDGNDKPTIKDFTAHAKAGQKIAIVGPTGAGKTTMVNLLMKFYDIDSGDIKIDGVSTKDLTRKNIHELFTMVLQDTWLFEGTIKENIVYNMKDVKEEKIEEVCKEVGLNHFIKTLPHGYDSEISDNDSVSAGQRQLLTIARGMIEEAPFLILDEATSNVDTRTEELVQQAMDKLTEGKTSFIIAHRLSTIKNADLILVMKDGNIIEMGNHKQLMKQKGFYADLYNSQFEL